MVLPGNIPKFSLNTTPQKLNTLTQEIINILQQNVKSIIELSENKKINKLDLLKEWHKVESLAAEKQTFCTLPSLVHFDSKVREESALAKKRIKDAWNQCYSQEKVYAIFKSIGPIKDPMDQRLLDKTLHLFKRNGLDLPKNKQKTFQEIQLKITELENKFIQNINESVVTLSFTLSELDGCSENFINSLTKKTEKNDDGKEQTKYIVNLKPPELKELIQNANMESTRKTVLTASHSRCKDENLPLFKEILATRQKMAELLNYDNHSNFMLSQNMCKNLDNANQFLYNILNPLKPVLHQELQKLLEIKKKTCEKHNWSYDNELHLWDISYYERILKDEEYSVDDVKVSGYFPVENVISGILSLYQEILHIKFEKVETELWHKDVMMYAVYDNHNVPYDQKGDNIGFMVLDLFPRDGKYSHQCVMPLAPSYIDNKNQQNIPVVVIIGNLTKSTNDSVSLLKHTEVVTFFHEFGHVMHALCTKSMYSRFSWSWTAIPYPVGIEMDALEVPSQMFENWIWDAKVLKRLSCHYKTKEQLPDDLIASICKTRHINDAYKYSRQIFMSLFDLKVHSNIDIEIISNVWEKMQKEYTNIETISNTSFLCSWYHLTMGYDAGYYSYLWSEVYSHDLYTKFAESSKGCMDTDLGFNYRKFILEPGANDDFINLMKKFLGRPPNNNAFLKYLNITN
ncbi:Metalloendopeptidase family-saccharolysin & [Piromyces finnis]|uniref:Metalloendopeptidase family-saccharolysin n=1 Tax=Piromyces finnis TaxID=1754191 RepID=A0A1Y1V0M6_9FUNG|nr:Metalloendopeptidase family-saccharolysin & [Piromyces finnis]|eukprot:ORX44127.1 Metalloendopeptidase family-saccharolysin & [Piromyces finnis]